MESWFKAKVETEKEYPEIQGENQERAESPKPRNMFKEEAKSQCPQVQTRKKWSINRSLDLATKRFLVILARISSVR